MKKIYIHSSCSISIQHPETGEWEKQEYNEITELTFPDYDTATAYTDEWIEIWQDYLDDQS